VPTVYLEDSTAIPEYLFPFIMKDIGICLVFISLEKSSIMRRPFFLFLTVLICFSCKVDDEVPKNEAIPFPGTYTGTTTLIVKQNEFIYDSVGNIIDVVEYQDTMESMDDTVWVEIGSTGQSFLLSTKGIFERMCRRLERTGGPMGNERYLSDWRILFRL
jgi:hypothetical protein